MHDQLPYAVSHIGCKAQPYRLQGIDKENIGPMLLPMGRNQLAA